MGAQQVFRSLLEVFPHVDIRILKVVSIEHANDVDAAVEFILSEALPSIVGTSKQGVPSGKQVVGEVNSSTPSDSESVAWGSALSDEPALLDHLKPCVREVGEGSGDGYGFDPNESSPFVPNQKVANGSSTGLLSEDNLEKLKACRSLSDAPIGSNDEKSISDVVPEEVSLAEQTFLSYQGSGKFGKDTTGSSAQVLHESVTNETISPVLENLSSVSLKMPVWVTEELSLCSNMPIVNQDLMDVGSGMVKGVTDSTTEYDDWQSGCAVEVSDSSTFDARTVSVDNSSMPLTVTTRSGYVVSIDLLEDFIADANNSKKTLLSAMDSVSSMLKEVELLEERAKQAKEEASTAGEDILSKAEEMKQMLKHAKETNDMHAGEVNAEKAILATETRELQSRLLSLSNERNRSLLTIEEVRKTIEARLAAAEREIAAAEKEKLEKVELANKSLHEQEGIMGALVEQSKILQQDAEENSKLREFLMDRGHAVNVLQGEIAVISEDVILLKERVDGRVPLSRYLSLLMSSLTASSNSISHKSMASPIRVPSPVGSVESSRITDQEELPLQQLEGVEQNDRSTSNQKQKSAMEDGWELFETSAEAAAAEVFGAEEGVGEGDPGGLPPSYFPALPLPLPLTARSHHLIHLPRRRLRFPSRPHNLCRN